MKARLLIAPVFLLLLSLAPACANDTGIWDVGGAIRPMQEHPSIVMEKMDLRVDIYPEIGRARCDYLFHNTGPATVVRMGFPETVTGPRAGRPRGFLTFATTGDGHAVPARVEGGLAEGPWDITCWRVKTVRFRAGQRRRIQVSYTSELGITLGNKQRRVFSHKIQTGASWKGPIGSVRVRVSGHYDPSQNWLEVGPQFRQTGPISFEWSTRNLEPTEELYFRYYGDDIVVTLGGTRVHWLDYGGDVRLHQKRRGLAPGTHGRRGARCGGGGERWGGGADKRGQGSQAAAGHAGDDAKRRSPGTDQGTLPET